MRDKILLALKENDIEKYFINETKKSSAELFFVKKKLDLSRAVDVTDYTLTVYKDFESGGKMLTGSSEFKIEEGMDYAEIYDKVRAAYEACEYAGNPFFSFEPGIKEVRGPADDEISNLSLNDAALKIAEAVFRNDNNEEAFVNSAEIFIYKKQVRITGGNGCDVSYVKYSAEGEFVVQCTKENDVEMYYSFRYDSLDTDALAEKVKQALERVVLRSEAKTAAPAGNYRVVLSDKSVETIMSYYMERAGAWMIYPGYSNYKKGMDVMGETSGDRVTMKLCAKEPFSDEGITMKDRTLLESGVLKTVQGHTRLASYLGEKPTGVYRAAEVECGKTSYEDMTKGKVLHAVSFSDFQMDPFSGYFNGEIRLAYLYEDGKMTPVTGGSVSGNFIELQKSMLLSAETQRSSTFKGPKYVMFDNVTVSGK